ncbi:MAG: HEPN domain-containing protein [Prosthecobacter sp.]|uniref:HEPN domain-containing protein n=1 Tax=Prosthecobacter sp. TaxID=1965333 RepID=UPI0038FEDE1B
MDQATIDSARRWLIKASHDLLAAERGSVGDDEALDTCVYHCQQAAEKALKGFLLAHAVSFPKTHSLVLLLPMCSAVNPSFQQWRTEAALLSPLAFMFRYPDDFAPLNPTREEFTEALAAARRIYNFVLSVLPPETHPT